MSGERLGPPEPENETYAEKLKRHYIAGKGRYPHDLRVIETALASIEYPADSALAEFLVTLLQEKRLVTFVGSLARHKKPNLEEIAHYREELNAARDRRKEIGNATFGSQATTIVEQTTTLFFNQRIKSGLKYKGDLEKERRHQQLTEISTQFPLSKLPFRPL